MRLQRRFIKFYTWIRAWHKQNKISFFGEGTHLLADMSQPQHIQEFQVLALLILTPLTNNKIVEKSKDRLQKSGHFNAYAISQLPIKDLIEFLDGVTYKYKKAIHIKELSAQILNEHQGLIPKDQKQLKKLKGIGNQLSELFLERFENFESKQVDVNHNTTIFLERIGILTTDDSKDEKKVQEILQSLIDPILWKTMYIPIDVFVDRQCTIENPNCISCPFQKSCQIGKSTLKQDNKK